MFASELNVLTLMASSATGYNCQKQSQQQPPPQIYQQYCNQNHYNGDNRNYTQTKYQISGKSKCCSNKNKISSSFNNTQRYCSVNNNNNNYTYNKNSKKIQYNYYNNYKNNNSNIYYSRKNKQFQQQQEHLQQSQQHYREQQYQQILLNNNMNKNNDYNCYNNNTENNYDKNLILNNNNNSLIQNQNLLSTVAASVDLLLCTSPTMLTNFTEKKTNSIEITTPITLNKKKVMNCCLSSLRNDTSEQQLSGPPVAKGNGAVSTSSSQKGNIKLTPSTLPGTSTDCRHCKKHYFCSNCWSNINQEQLNTKVKTGKTKPSNPAHPSSSTGSGDRKECPPKSKHHNNYHRKKSHWKSNNNHNNHPIPLQKENIQAKSGTAASPGIVVSNCNTNNNANNNNKVNAGIERVVVANSLTEQSQGQMQNEIGMTKTIIAPIVAESNSKTNTTAKLISSNSNINKKFQPTSVIEIQTTGEESLITTTINAAPRTESLNPSMGSSAATISSPPASPNSYSLQFLHEVGKRMSNAGTIPPYKTPLFPETVAFPSSAVLPNPPNRPFHYPYTNVPDPSSTRPQRFNGLGNQYPAHHHYPHHNHHYHHPQPSQLTIASFLQKDLLSDAFSTGSGGSSSSGNRGGYDGMTHYPNQHRYPGFYAPSFPALAQQHNFISPQGAFSSMTDGSARLLSSSSGCRTDNMSHRSHHHNYYGGNATGHSTHHQRNSYHNSNNNANSNGNMNNNRTNNNNNHNIHSNQSQNNAMQHAHADAHPEHAQQTQQKKISHISSSASSCSSSSSVSSMSSLVLNRQPIAQSNTQLNGNHKNQPGSQIMPIETVPKKTGMQHQSHRQQRHHGSSHHNTNSTPSTPKHQNYSNLTYVNTESNSSTKITGDVNQTRLPSSGSSTRLMGNSSNYPGYKKRYQGQISRSSTPTQGVTTPTGTSDDLTINGGSQNYASTTISAGNGSTLTHKISIPAAIYMSNDCDSDTSSNRSSARSLNQSQQQQQAYTSNSGTTPIPTECTPAATIDMSYVNGFPTQGTPHFQQQTLMVSPSQQGYRSGQSATTTTQSTLPPQQTQIYYTPAESINSVVAVNMSNSPTYWSSVTQPQTNLMFTQTGVNLLTGSSIISTSSLSPISDRDDNSCSSSCSSTTSEHQLKRRNSSNSVSTSSSPPPQQIVSIQQGQQRVTTQSTSTASGSIAAVAALRARTRTQQQLQSQASQERNASSYNQSYQRSVTPSVLLDPFSNTPPDRFLARSHLVEAKDVPANLLSNCKFDRLSQDIWNKFITSQQTEDTYKHKMRLWRFLYIIIKNSYPRYGLYLVGSTISGFGADTSDVDMCLVSRNMCSIDQRMEAVFNLNLLKDCLSKSEEFEHFKLIEAKVPILRFRDRVHQLEVDLNFNNCVGIKNTHLLYCYSQLDWRLRPLVLVAKLWAQYHNINNAKNMTISSYSLVLMMIHFLQYAAKPAVLPNLHEIFPEKFTLLCSNDFGYVDMNELLEPYDNGNDQSIGELFLQFLEYYSFFNYSHYAISIRTGGLLPINVCRQAKAPKNDAHQWKELCIEEPFDLTNTARSVYDFETFERVKCVFQASWRILKNELQLNAIFQPIQTPITPARSIPDAIMNLPKMDCIEQIDTMETQPSRPTKPLPMDVDDEVSKANKQTTASVATMIVKISATETEVSTVVASSSTIEGSKAIPKKVATASPEAKSDVTMKREQATYTKDDAQEVVEEMDTSSSEGDGNSNRTNNSSTTTITAIKSDTTMP